MWLFLPILFHLIGSGWSPVPEFSFNGAVCDAVCVLLLLLLLWTTPLTLLKINLKPRNRNEIPVEDNVTTIHAGSFSLINSTLESKDYLVQSSWRRKRKLRILRNPGREKEPADGKKVLELTEVMGGQVTKLETWRSGLFHPARLRMVSLGKNPEVMTKIISCCILGLFVLDICLRDRWRKKIRVMISRWGDHQGLWPRMGWMLTGSTLCVHLFAFYSKMVLPRALWT